MRADHQLWDGMDEVSMDSFQDVSRVFQAEWSRRDAASEGPERSIHVLGLQDTGTNLLTSSLLLNFGPRLRYFDWSYKENATGNFGHGIWKHANICERANASKEHMEMMRKENVTALIMVREPLSWLQSLRKAPYELKDCVSGEDWLQRPCTHPTPAGYRSGVPAQQFVSLPFIWTEWVSAYQSWAECGFAHALIIKYEDMVERPQEVLVSVANHLGIEVPSYWRIMDIPSKTHGMSLGRSEALNKIESKEYLNEYFGTDRIDSCKHLNREVQLSLNYTQCDGYWGYGWMMWNGGEVPTKALVKEFLPFAKQQTAPIGIQVFGLQNSGTSLLMSLLMLNFGNRMTYLDSQFPEEGDNSTAFAPGFWRHAQLPQRSAYVEHIARRHPGMKTIALTVVRNPFTWVESLRRMDFERSNMSCLKSCILGDDWLERPCQHRCPGGKQTVSAGPIYSNVFGIWDAWSRSYIQARKHQSFNDTLRIRYEDLVLYPETILQRIANHVGLRYKTPAQLISNKGLHETQVHYQRAGRNEAMYQVRHETGMGILTNPQKQVLCRQLSHTLMQSLGYKDCSKLAGWDHLTGDEAVSLTESFADTGLR